MPEQPLSPRSLELEFDLSEIDAIAEKIIDAAAGSKIWLFHGEPGAGKTTLIKSIVAALGGDSTLVTSPTFAIMNRYETKAGSINHFDLYRTKSLSELLDLGLPEFLDSGDHCFIEWPERLESLRPENCFEIFLKHRSLAGANDYRALRLKY